MELEYNNDIFQSFDKKQLSFHNAFINAFARIDSMPKNIFLPIEKGKEYESFCSSLAKGWDLEYISPNIIVNEFGEAEYFDKFKERHPTFEEDIRNIKILA